MQGTLAQCAAIQNDVRGLLARLQPLGGVAEADQPISVGALSELLEVLAEGWRTSARGALQVTIEIDAARERTLPRDLALALYRITQEALTNVARHAQATRVEVRIAWPHDAAAIEWSVSDNGVGLADGDAALRRGNGLAGIKEQV